MLLVYGIQILMRSDTYQVLNEEASTFLRKFVYDYSSLYGNHLITYNVRSLIHLPMFS